MRVLLAVCAAGASVDRFSNRLSIFNVMEEIPSPTFPVWIPEMTFVVVLRKENNEPPQFQARCRVQVGEAVISEGTLDVDFGPNNTARGIMNFQGLPITTPGDVTFHLLLPNNGEATVIIPAIRVGGNVPVRIEEGAPR
jgi:hypothetical protein